MNGKFPGLLIVGIVALLLVPAGQGFHGGWWRARDLPATSEGMGLDHTAHPISTATNLATGEVLRADVQWSGQQFFGTAFDGLLSLKFYDEAGTLVHQAAILSDEDISNVQWVQCPPGTGDPHTDLETLPTYSMETPNVLRLDGVMRNSFCGNFNDPNDPYYFKDFSDHEGTYLLTTEGSVIAYALHLHVRWLDHG